jgi:hypothetical protein
MRECLLGIKMTSLSEADDLKFTGTLATLMPVDGEAE